VEGCNVGVNDGETAGQPVLYDLGSSWASPRPAIWLQGRKCTSARSPTGPAAQPGKEEPVDEGTTKDRRRDNVSSDGES
jgi:hypothetical protein